jgi:Holliday junction resolvasome RuvABC endonuclease subunit
VSELYALGLDSGPSKSGAALVRLDDAGWPHIEIGGHYENDSPELRRLIQRAAMVRATVGVEHVVHAFSKKNEAAIIETARVEGRFEERAIGYGATVVQIEARSWRGQLTGSPRASDKQIRIAIEGLCKTLPGGKAVEREHVYDAAGVAIAALAIRTGRAVSVPAAVMAQVHAQREYERATRGQKAETKRSPTRAQTKRRSKAAKAAWAARSHG